MARVATPAAVEIGGLVISEGGHRDQSEARLRRQTLPGASTGRNSGRGPDWRLRRSMSCGIAYSHARHFFTALINYANNAALIGAPSWASCTAMIMACALASASVGNVRPRVSLIQRLSPLMGKKYFAICGTVEICQTTTFTT
jgi:hypothetical protein